MTDAAQTILEVDDTDVILLAWCGQNSTPEGGWPNTDADAFEAALADHALAELDMIDDRDEPMGSGDDEYCNSLAAYMDALIIQERAYL